MILYSLIMAAYNEEHHIKRAVDSVIAQTYDNWELLIVDDGSSDNTLNIAKEYSSQDKRIRVFSQPHSGIASSARNTAMQHMIGDYMMMVDADDYISTDMLEKINARLDQHSFDIVVPIQRYLINGVERSAKCLGFGDIVLTGAQAFYMSLDWTVPGTFCVRSDIIRQLGGWDEEFFASDDITFHKLYYNADKVAFVDASYYYCQNDQGTTKSAENRTKLYYFLVVYYRLYEYTLEMGMEEQTRIAAAGSLLNMLIDHKTTYNAAKDTYTPEEQKEIEYIHNYVTSELIRKLIIPSRSSEDT